MIAVIATTSEMGISFYRVDVDNELDLQRFIIKEYFGEDHEVVSAYLSDRDINDVVDNMNKSELFELMSECMDHDGLEGYDLNYYIVDNGETFY